MSSSPQVNVPGLWCSPVSPGFQTELHAFVTLEINLCHSQLVGFPLLIPAMSADGVKLGASIIYPRVYFTHSALFEPFQRELNTEQLCNSLQPMGLCSSHPKWRLSGNTLYSWRRRPLSLNWMQQAHCLQEVSQTTKTNFSKIHTKNKLFICKRSLPHSHCCLLLPCIFLLELKLWNSPLPLR